MRATFDTTYDDRSGSLNGVACCSNGENGLVARFPTSGNIPTFPFIGGAPDVVFNSANCGGCWKLTSTTTGASLIMRWVWFQPRTRGICNLERWANKTGRIRCGCQTSGSSYLWTCLDDWCYVFGVLWARSNYDLLASSSLSGNEASSLSEDRFSKPKRE